MQLKEDSPNCPACNAVRAPGAAECGACGVVFEKWKRKQERELGGSARSLDAGGPALAPAPERSLFDLAGMAGYAFLLGGAGGIGWLFWAGSAGAVPPDADKDKAGEFAFVGPEGWESRSVSDSCGDLWGACTMRSYQPAGAPKDRLVPLVELRRIPLSPRTLAGGGSVQVRAAEYAEFDAKPVVGRVAVPVKEAILVFCYRHDQSDAASAQAIERSLSSLRLLKRSKPVDRLEGGQALTALLALGSLFGAGLKLLA